MSDRAFYPSLRASNCKLVSLLLLIICLVSATSVKAQTAYPVLVQRLDTWGTYTGYWWTLSVTAGALYPDGSFAPLPASQQFQLLTGGDGSDPSFGGFLRIGSYYYFGTWEDQATMRAAYPWATFTPSPSLGPNKNGHWRVDFGSGGGTGGGGGPGGSGGTGAPEIDVQQAAGWSLTDNSAAPVSFSAVYLGNSNSLTFTIRNVGTANLTGLGITIDGANASDFVVSQYPTAPVGPNGSTTFVVRFTPGGLNSRTATLHIANNDADENPFDIPLLGIGLGSALAPEIAVEQPAGYGLTDNSTTPVTFPTANVGSSSTLTFTIKNVGGPSLTDLNIYCDGANWNDFSVIQYPATSLGQNGSTTFAVSFAPSGSGTRTATLHIESNDSDENPFDSLAPAL